MQRNELKIKTGLITQSPQSNKSSAIRWEGRGRSSPDACSSLLLVFSFVEWAAVQHGIHKRAYTQSHKTECMKAKGGEDEESAKVQKREKQECAVSPFGQAAACSTHLRMWRVRMRTKRKRPTVTRLRHLKVQHKEDDQSQYSHDDQQKFARTWCGRRVACESREWRKGHQHARLGEGEEGTRKVQQRNNKNIGLRASSGRKTRRSPAPEEDDDEEEELENAAMEDGPEATEKYKRVNEAVASSCARVKRSPGVAAADQEDHEVKNAPYDHGQGSTKVNITQPNIHDQHSDSPENDEGGVVEGQGRGSHTPRSGRNRQENKKPTTESEGGEKNETRLVNMVLNHKRKRTQ